MPVDCWRPTPRFAPPLGSPSAWLKALWLAGAVLLVGCAAQSTYSEGRGLVEQGRMADGLAKLQEAARLSPDNAEYRAAYVRTRDRYARLLVEQGDQARAKGRYAQAQQLYQQALATQGERERAQAGLQAIEQQQRWDRAVQDAEAAMARQDWAAARRLLQPVLLERPQDPTATQLLQRIEEASAASATPADVALSDAYRKPISIEFRDAPLRTVFDVISRTSRLNFVFDKDVRTDARTSIYLRNSTVEAAVNWLLLTQQLQQRVLDANSILIFPATAAKQREYEPLTVRSFYLANADAKTVANTVKTMTRARDVVVDDKLNLIIVRDTPEGVKLAAKLVALHDVAEPEVMLEVEVLEIQRSRLLDLGIQWPDQVGLSLLPSISGSPLTLEDVRNAGRGSVGVTVGPTVISAKKQDTDTNLLANPRIRARNHEKAKILIGERVPNITSTSTSTGFLAESINYVDVGLKLEVEPTVYLENDVGIKVSLEVSSVIRQIQTKSGSIAYQLGTRTAQTVLRLKDGENQVLAGLINDDDRRTANKVPLLGELPIAGRLFGRRADNAEKTEIVLSITPRILRNIQRPDAKALEFESGTEASPRLGPAGPVARASASAEGTVVGRPVAAELAPTPALEPASPGASTAVPDGPARLVPSSDASSAPTPVAPGTRDGEVITPDGGQPGAAEPADPSAQGTTTPGRTNRSPSPYGGKRLR